MKKNLILRYGTYAGLLLSALMLSSVVLFPMKAHDPTVGMLIGYAGMLLGFTFILVGVKNARNLAPEKWNFGRAFLIGLGMMAIACVFYTVAWFIYMYGFDPQWMENYISLEIERIKGLGLSPEETSAKIYEVEEWRELSKNPLLFGLFIYMEPLPPGILMSLIAAFIWRKKV